MADNVTLQDDAPATPPDATVWATKDIGGAHYVPSLIADPDDPSQMLAVDANGAASVKLPKGSKTLTTASPGTSASSVLAANASRKSATIHNAGLVTVYLGPSGVTTSDGIPLAPNATLSDDSTSDAWYGITSSGTGSLRVLEVA